MYIQNTVGQLQLSQQERATPFGQLAASLESVVTDIVSAFTAQVSSPEQMVNQLLGPELPAFIDSLSVSAERLGAILRNIPLQDSFMGLSRQLEALIQEAIVSLQAIRASAELLSTLNEDHLRERLDTNESLLRRAEFMAENPATAAGYQGLLQTGWAWAFGTLDEIRQGAEAEVVQLTQTINRLRRDIGTIGSQRQSAYQQIAEQKSNSILKLIQVGELAKGIIMGTTDTDRIQELLQQYLPNAGQLRDRTTEATQAVQRLQSSLAQLQGINNLNRRIGELVESDASRQQAYRGTDQVVSDFASRLDTMQGRNAQLNSTLTRLDSSIGDLRNMYGQLVTRNIPARPQRAQQGGGGLGLILLGLLLIGGLSVLFLPTILKKIKGRQR